MPLTGEDRRGGLDHVAVKFIVEQVVPELRERVAKFLQGFCGDALPGLLRILDESRRLNRLEQALSLLEDNREHLLIVGFSDVRYVDTCRKLGIPLSINF